MAHKKPLIPEPVDPQVDLDRRFMSCIDKGAEQDALQLLREGANPNARQHLKATVLVSALTVCLLRDFSLAFVEQLLAGGALPDGHGREDCKVPLAVAVQKARTDVVAALCNAGAQLDPFHQNGGPFLMHEAASIRDEEAACEMIDTLIKMGMDVDQKRPLNLQQFANETPLQMSCERFNREQVVARLLHHGANPNASNQSSSAAWRAVRMGQAEVLRMLHSRGLNLHPGENGGASLLSGCFEPLRLTMLKTLLGLGADPNSSTEGLMRPLAIAVENGHAEAVEALLNAGADPALTEEYCLQTRADVFGFDTISNMLRAREEKLTMEAQAPQANSRKPKTRF